MSKNYYSAKIHWPPARADSGEWDKPSDCLIEHKTRLNGFSSIFTTPRANALTNFLNALSDSERNDYFSTPHLKENDAGRTFVYLYQQSGVLENNPVIGIERSELVKHLQITNQPVESFLESAISYRDNLPKVNAGRYDPQAYFGEFAMKKKLGKEWVDTTIIVPQNLPLYQPIKEEKKD